MTLPTTPDLQQPFPQAFQILPDGSFAGYTQGVGPASIGGPGLGDGPYFVRAASDRTFAFRDAEVVAERFGIQLVRTTSPPRAAWALVGANDDTGRIPAGWPPVLLVTYPTDPEQREQPVRLVLGTMPGATRGHVAVVNGERVYVHAGKTVEVETVARPDENGQLVVSIEAPARKLDATRGIQVLNVWLD
jgi:hypothetical protein